MFHSESNCGVQNVCYEYTECIRWWKTVDKFYFEEEQQMTYLTFKCK